MIDRIWKDHTGNNIHHNLGAALCINQTVYQLRHNLLLLSLYILLVRQQLMLLRLVLELQSTRGDLCRLVGDHGRRFLACPETAVAVL